jgi:hypothetical protein
MSMLQIFRSLAVLLILAVAVLNFTPGSASGGDKTQNPRPRVCAGEGQQCPPFRPCCPGLVCMPASTRAFCVDVY